MHAPHGNLSELSHCIRARTHTVTHVQHMHSTVMRLLYCIFHKLAPARTNPIVGEYVLSRTCLCLSVCVCVHSAYVCEITCVCQRIYAAVGYTAGISTVRRTRTFGQRWCRRFTF